MDDKDSLGMVRALALDLYLASVFVLVKVVFECMSFERNSLSCVLLNWPSVSSVRVLAG